jgi:hypothetical protein
MNKSTRTNVATLGTIFGISGICHGFFEVLQGNTPTNGLMISAIVGVIQIHENRKQHPTQTALF